MMEISIHAWLITRVDGDRRPFIWSARELRIARTRLPVLMEPLQLVSPIILAVSPIFLGRRVCVGGDRFDLCSQTVRQLCSQSFSPRAQPALARTDGVASGTLRIAIGLKSPRDTYFEKSLRSEE